MPQICPSPSGQLAAAAQAFRRARQKFPKNLGTCACSGDADRCPPEVYSAIARDGDNIVETIRLDLNKKTDRSFHSDPQQRGNYASYQSLSSSQAASWSNDCRGDQRAQIIEDLNVILKAEDLCTTCGKRNNCSKAANCNSRVYQIEKDQGEAFRVKDVETNPRTNPRTSTSTSRRICTRVEAVESRESNLSRNIETASKSTHSSAGPKKRKHVRHRRACIHSERIRGSSSQSSRKIQGASQICLLHGFPDHNRKVSTACHSKRKENRVDNQANEERETIHCSSPCTIPDFPNKRQTWQHEPRKGPYAVGDLNPNSKRGEILSHQCPNHKKNCLNNRIYNSSSNREGITRNSHTHENDNSSPRLPKKFQEPSSNRDICLRPSLIKAAQRKVGSEIREGGKYRQNYGVCNHKSKNLDLKSTWDENLSLINHKDSMSILMEKFRGNNQPHNLKLQNIYELNSVLGSKTSCGVEKDEPIRLGKYHRGNDSAANQFQLLRNFDDVESESTENNSLPRKSSSGVNPVTKLGRVANQALRENETHLKNLRSRINKSGICCSSKGTRWRRAF